MFDIVTLFTSLSAYEYHFDQTKNQEVAKMLSILVSFFTILSAIFYFFRVNYSKQFYKEILGSLAIEDNSFSAKFKAFLWTVSKWPAYQLIPSFADSP
jgi:hypothetical protein